MPQPYRIRKRLGQVSPRPAKLHPGMREFALIAYRQRKATQIQLAAFLGCSQSTVHRIISEWEPVQ
jgi:Helix-turn-helix of DDE superfamily endonuclease